VKKQKRTRKQKKTKKNKKKKKILNNRLPPRGENRATFYVMANDDTESYR